jgi:hypothetical protein
MGWLARCWNGEEELWKIIWIYGAFFILLGKVTVVILRLTTSVDLDNPTDGQETFLLWLEAIYCLWMLMSLWRCSFNADWHIWGYFVRTLIIFYILFFFLFSFFAGNAIEPKEVVIKSGIIIQHQTVKWMKKNEIDFKFLKKN